MPVVLVTGGQGFIGKAFATRASLNGYDVRVSSRRKFTSSKVELEHSHVGDLGPSTNWFAALQGVGTVVHCAGRAHVIKEMTVDPLTAFRTVNVEGTLNLARQAVESGVNRFIFISSIGVNGAQTVLGKPFTETDKPNPHNAYALSKWEAEQGLLLLADETGLEVVIIRPPLVYGFNAPGSFGSLFRAVQCGWPLPLGAVHNQRSLIALDNLVDFIITCTSHPQAAHQTFLVSDGKDLSTTELVRGIAQASRVPVRLLPVPVWALQAGASFLGKVDAVQRLCGSLQIDISKACSLLNWVPPLSTEEGLRRAVQQSL